MAKLLIVDKHTEVLKWIEKRLSLNENLEIVKTTSCNEAEVLMREKNPDILLIDPYMGNGLCLNEIGKYKDLYPKMIVIVFAAVIDDEDRKLFSEIHVNYVLEKRLACEKLVQTINLALEISTSKNKNN